MADFLKAIEYQRPTICSADYNSAGGAMYVAGGAWTGTLTWPLANLALYLPFVISVPTTIVKMFWLNLGTVGTDHVDVGIYDSQGNRLVSSGSTLTSGASAVQTVDITDTLLEPGLYYMAMARDATTDNFSGNSSTGAPAPRAAGVYEQTSAFPLPSAATFAGSTRNQMPNLVLTINTTV